MRKRKSARAKFIDYRAPGYYFITTNIKYFIPVFGEIRNKIMYLKEAGVIAWQCWYEIPKHFDVKIDEFIVMPDHIHGILILPNKPDNHPLYEIVGLYKSSVTRIIRSQIVGRGHDPALQFVRWHKSYHDRIIRDHHELNRIRNYIRTNPARWNPDRHSAA